jgi:hypothetical protein
LVEEFDSADLGDVLDRLSEVSIEVEPKGSRHLVQLEDDVLEELVKAARDQRVTTHALVHAILRERLAEAS